MANKTLLVAQREYLENVRTKTFWISIFIVPVLLALSFGASALLNRFKQVQDYTVLDLGTGDLAARAERMARQDDLKALFSLAKDPRLAELAKSLGDNHGAAPDEEQMQKILQWMQEQDPKTLAAFAGIDVSRRFHYVPLKDLALPEGPPEQQREALNKLVQKGRLYAYFVLGKDPEQSLDDFDYVSNNLTDSSLRNWYENALTQLVQKQRIGIAGISPQVAEHIQQRVEFKKQQVDAAGATADVKKENELDKWAPVAFVYFLWIAIFSIANLLLTNTIEEKSNRVIEVLLSSVSPGQLMAGKVWGIATTGLTIIGTWVVFGLIAANLAPYFFGDGGGTMIKFLVTALKNSDYLIAFVLYFLAGYLLYAAILVALGSVCNSLKEAQNLMQPVMILLFVPLVAMLFIIQEPNGVVAKVMSFIPLFTPFTMMNRAGGPPATWEYVATGLLLLVTILVTFKAAGKIFRVGILMTGKPPKLKEILGWLRQG